MILPERVLGRPGANWITSGRGDGADFLAHQFFQLLAQRIGGRDARLERHVGIDALALDVVRIAHHGGFGDLGVAHQRAFHFRGAQAMARDIDHVVHPAGDPVIAIRIAAAAIAGEIFSRDRF